MKDAPAFDFYPERWLVGTASLSDQEQICYLRLLCHQWLMQGLPADHAALKRLAGKGITDAVLAKLPVGDDGKRRNFRLEIVRNEQRLRIEKSRAKIQRMNEARTGKNKEKAPLQEPLQEGLQEPLVDALQGPPHHSPLTTHPVLLEKEPKRNTGISAEIAEPLRSLFGRRESTGWTDKEVAAFRKLKIPTAQILADLALFAKARSAGWSYYRRDTITLLNNWQGEVERCEDFLKTAPSQASKYGSLNPQRGKC